ncbi:lipopolysaccharide biosynthesis protein [Collinsella stercoris]|uniref:lipopolysaccharide biosynthesis protein n=1 Tax=Collinsella stercoris TaxID=147206 RepID=UPI003993A2D3
MASQRKAGAVLGYLNIIVKNLVNLVYTPMLLAFVGQADYGVYQTANSFVFSLTLLTFGFSEAYIRFYTQEKAKGDECDIRRLNGMYLMLYIVVCTVALSLGLLFSANVATFFAGSFTSEQVGLAGELMAIMSFNVAATLFSTVFDAYILAHEQFKFQQSRQMFTSLATPGVAFVLLNVGMGAVGVASAQLAVTLTLLVLNARFAIVKLDMKFDISRFDGSLFRAIAAFSAWIFGNQVCELVNQSVPNMILGALSGAVTVSVFAVSINIRGIFVSLSTVMSNVFVPKINRIVAESDDNAELTRLMTRVGRYQMFLFCWVYCGFILLGRFFIVKWAGEGFMDAYWLISTMALPLVIPLCQNTGIEIQRAKNRHKARSVVYLCMALLNVAFTWVASPYLGYWAPAIAYIASISLGNGLFMNWYYHARIGLDMGYFWRRNLPVALVSAGVLAVCMGFVHLAPVSNWLLFLVWGAVYTTLFALAMWRFVLDGDERASIAAKVPFLNREA